MVYGIPFSGLERGLWYQLAVEVDHGTQSATARRNFWLGSGVQAAAERQCEQFSEEDAELNRRLIAYIATPTEQTEFQALSLEAKCRFLKDFWQRRDPDPTTVQNEFFDQHILRFATANQKFSVSMTRQDDGWKTDRGRVIILYGQPDRIEQNPSSIGTWAWERWEYDRIEGGVYFIFLDWKNLGDFRLMHSTKQGERFDPDWQRKIDIEGLDILNR